MNYSECGVSYGNHEIQFSVQFVNRKTMEIAVYPNDEVVVKAPLGTVIEDVKKKIQKRARWIVKQQRYFRQFKPTTPVRQYIGGETHLYLGKKYRLKITEADIENVKLTHGFFRIQVNPEVTPEKVKNILLRWYAKKAAQKVTEIINVFWDHFEGMKLEKPVIQIRNMRTRWGSLSKRKTLMINSNLIKAPRECIEYVIVHELCHLKYHDHSKEFYNLLEKILPNWKKIKHKLEITMS